MAHPDVSCDEILQAVRQFNPSKAPGTGRYACYCLSRCWHIIGKNICLMIKSFLKSGHLLRETNRTHNILIWKRQILKKFLIIDSLVVYKFFWELLANRFRMMLPMLTSPLQSAFVPNRDIYDDNLIVHEVLSMFPNTVQKNGFMTIKLNMEKTYDRLK